MKLTFLIIFSTFIGLVCAAQDSTNHEPFFELPRYFQNDFGYKLIIAKGHFGLIDSNGVVVCEPAYDWINSFNGDFAIVDLKGKKGFINKHGKAIIPAKYKSVNDFRNHWAMGSVKNRWFYIDTNGNELQGFGQHPNLHDFKQGPKLKRLKHGVKYINEKDEDVIDDGYIRGAPFINGYAIVNKDKKQFLIDTLGEVIQTFDCVYAGVLRNGLNVLVMNNKKKGIVDHLGQEVIPCEYDEIEIEEDGIIRVKKDFKWGAYNWDFELIIPNIYDRIDYVDFDITRNKIVMVTDGPKKGLIDFDGKTIKECIYDYLIINEDLTIITIQYPLPYSSTAQTEEEKQMTFNEYLKKPEINGYQISDKNGTPLLDRPYYFAKQVHENYFMVADLVGIYIPYRFHGGPRGPGGPYNEFFMLKDRPTKSVTHINILRTEANIISTYETPTDMKSENILTFCDFHELLAQVKHRPGGYYSLNKTELGQLQTIADKGDVAISVNARAILNFLNESFPYQGGVQIDEGKSILNPESQDTKAEKLSINVYPNPFSKNTKIELSHSINQGQMTIVDLNGQVIQKRSFSGNKMELDLSNVEAGIYFCIVSAKSGVKKTIKLVVTG
ncbi:MAG: hypothetical protein ACI9J3_002547 [Parvicellaceae bacterium]|jgi:hypothetical protein